MKRVNFWMRWCMMLLTIGSFPLNAEQELSIGEATIKQMQTELMAALSEAVGQRTHRQGVVLKLETQQDRQTLRLNLSERDARDTLFQLQLSGGDTQVLVQGRFLNRQELECVQQILSRCLSGRAIKWELTVANVGFGVVSVPCADFYVTPVAEPGDNLGSQLLSGMPIILLETSRDGQFYHVQNCDDGYLGWLAANTLQIVPAAAWQHWVNMPKVYLTKTISTPKLYAATALGMTRNGDLLQFDGAVKMPIAESGYFAPGMEVLPAHIMSTARRFLAKEEFAPTTYLWGGTCGSAIDCSGFVQLVFRMNGILLPRDADQQYQFSQKVAWEAMQPGDLVFFSKRKDHPTHVGIYLGGDNFIHSSPSGGTSGVKISNFAGTTEYDKYLREIFFAAGRILK